MIAALSLSFLAVVNTKQSHLSILRFAAAVATAAAPSRQQERHDWLAKSRRAEMPATGCATAAAVAMSAGWAEQVEPAETAVLFNL